MKTIDLFHEIQDRMPVYPDDPPVTIATAAEHDLDGYHVCALGIGTHSGTHVDAPSHVVEGAVSLGSFPISDFRLDAQLAIVDVDAREPITYDQLPEPTDADVLVVQTGWDEIWGMSEYYDHPYLTSDVAAWCVENNYHLAIDFLSPDPTPTENARDDEPDGFPVHRRLLSAGYLIFENLTGLDAVPNRFTLSAYPLKIDSDGAPVRAVAEIR